jgi:hypothetical protein
MAYENIRDTRSRCGDTMRDSFVHAEGRKARTNSSLRKGLHTFMPNACAHAFSSHTPSSSPRRSTPSRSIQWPSRGDIYSIEEHRFIKQGRNRTARRENIKHTRSHRVSTTRESFVHAECTRARSHLYRRGFVRTCRRHVRTISFYRMDAWIHQRSR